MKLAPVSRRPDPCAAIIAGSSLDRVISELVQLDLLHIPGDTIEALLRANPIGKADLAPYLFFAPGRYTRNSIYRHTNFEVLALCWSLGARSPIHDHGANRCFVQIHHGKLVADEFTLLSGGREPGPAQLEYHRRQTLTTGDIDVRSPIQDIHRFTAVDGPAITVHIYAKPLDQFLVFDLQAQLCRRSHSRYDKRPHDKTLLQLEQ